MSTLQSMVRDVECARTLLTQCCGFETSKDDESVLVFMEASLTSLQCADTLSSYYTQLLSVYHSMKHAYSGHMFAKICNAVFHNPCNPRYRHINARIVQSLEAAALTLLMRIGYRKRWSSLSSHAFSLVSHLCDVKHKLTVEGRSDVFIFKQITCHSRQQRKRSLSTTPQRTLTCLALQSMQCGEATRGHR